MSSAADDEQIFQGETSEDIQDHLLWQMRLTHFSETDTAIAIAIIDSIDESGYLTISTEDVLASLDDEEIELDEVECVLKRIQMFDPIGLRVSLPSGMFVGATQSVCPGYPMGKRSQNASIRDYAELLGSKDYRTLMRKTRLKEDELREAMRLLQTLNPRPGSALITGEPEYVIPDVSVAKKEWQLGSRVKPGQPSRNSMLTSNTLP